MMQWRALRYGKEIKLDELNKLFKEFGKTLTRNAE